MAEKFDIDDKDLAVVALAAIAFFVVKYTGTEGLGVVTNIVCTLGGIVTGRALYKER